MENKIDILSQRTFRRVVGELLNAPFEISDCGIVPMGGIRNIGIEYWDRKFWR